MRQSATRPSPPGRRLAALLYRVAARLRSWRARSRARRELRELDDAVLRDLALSRTQANFDAGKPFWRA
jgi:uncharacterized protein YjiS (DUF1127 family)